MEKERIQKWDNLKAFLIFCVVFGHCLDFHTDSSETIRSLFVIIYTFHMPLFLFVSGMFSKGAINNKRIDKMLGYLVLYLVAKIVDWIYFGIFTQNYRIELLSASGLPWFMFILFACGIITMGIKNISPKYCGILIVIIGCMAGYDTDIGDYLCLARLLVFYPFYYLGFCIEPKWIEEQCHNYKRKIMACGIIAITSLLIWMLGDNIYFLRYFLSGRNSYASIGEIYSIYGAIVRLFCYIIGVVFSYAIIVLTPDKVKFNWITKIGRNTLAIYIFHYPVLYLLYNQFNIELVYEKVFATHPNIMVIPVAVIITLILSKDWLTEILRKVSTIPLKKAKDKSRCWGQKSY